MLQSYCCNCLRWCDRWGRLKQTEEERSHHHATTDTVGMRCEEQFGRFFRLSTSECRPQTRPVVGSRALRGVSQTSITRPAVSSSLVRTIIAVTMAPDDVKTLIHSQSNSLPRQAHVFDEGHRVGHEVAMAVGTPLGRPVVPLVYITVAMSSLR